MISENDFEESSHPSQTEPVAIVQKHAYKKVVVPSQSNGSPIVSNIEASIKEPSSSNIISDKAVGVIDGGRHGEASVSLGVSKNLDKINNLAQKEISLSKVGVTREKAYRVIAVALDAKKWADVIDRQGNVKQEYVDDLDKQRWGAEMAIKMFGDMIERKEIEYDVSDRTLDKFRAMSVSDLKARAADLLLGKRSALSVVTEAEVVRASS